MRRPALLAALLLWTAVGCGPGPIVQAEPTPELQAQSAGPSPPAAAAVEAAAPAEAQCSDTTVTVVEPRLQGDPESGVSIAFANGLRQTSYEVVPEVSRSRPGDPIRLCLVERPKNCPPGDDRGSRYSALNGRTGEQWALADSQHLCGGA